MSNKIILFLVILLGFSCATNTKPVQQAEVNVQQRNRDSEFEIFLCADHESNMYQADENIYLFFATNKNCYLTLLSISNNGKHRILLPNEYQKDNQAIAGYVYRIPSQNAGFNFKTIAHNNECTILAIATMDEVRLQDKINEILPQSPAENTNNDTIIESIYKMLENMQIKDLKTYQIKIKTVSKKEEDNYVQDKKN